MFRFRVVTLVHRLAMWSSFRQGAAADVLACTKIAVLMAL